MAVYKRVEEVPSLSVPPFVVGMPTETVYGLAARIDLPQGIEAIFKIKERPFFDPLIVHVNSLEQAKALTPAWSPAAQALAEGFWPGPLTLVLPKTPALNPMITSGLATVGLRMPNHPLALQLIAREGPLAAPSANKFGKTSPTLPEHVLSEFSQQVAVLDGGACTVGLESTVLEIQNLQEVFKLQILRPGHITQEQIESCLLSAGVRNFAWNRTPSRPLVIGGPGQLKHHYMPEVPLLLIETKGLPVDLEMVKEEALRKMQTLPREIEGVKIRRPEKIDHMKELILPQDSELAARSLYAELRNVASQAPDLIYFQVQPWHQQNAWLAVFDRLTKAASLIV